MTQTKINLFYTFYFYHVRKLRKNSQRSLILALLNLNWTDHKKNVIKLNGFF